MAFQTGTANDVDDLLDKIRLFLSAQGWTIDKWVPASSGYDAELYVHKGTEVYISMETAVQSGLQYYLGVNQVIDRPAINTYINTGFNTGNAVDAQPGGSGQEIQTDWLLAPIDTYWFFEDDYYLHVVCETVPGTYAHFGFGQLNKLGTYNYGVYAHGTRWNHFTSYIDAWNNAQHNLPFDRDSTNITHCSRILHDVEGVNKEYDFYAGGQDLNRAIGPGRGGPQMDMWVIPANDFNGLVTLCPSWVHTGAASGLWRPVGQVPDYRMVNIKSLVPGSTLSIGGDTWYVFPAVVKKDPADNTDDLINSGWLGAAYKQVT